ncbi:MAG TPA: cyclic nucleotide-binding domain-containing protein [Thermoanaerobaculia bacterium]|nr:cyclic nucleotide-binding domain-containing protein [Thermoanaerobaculia bacterium]
MAELATIERIIILQSADLFHFCKAEEVLRIAAIARERSYGPSEPIYQVQDLPDAIYCVVRGKVELAGGDSPGRTIGPLQTFGAAEILSGRLRAENAVAQDETLVVALDAEDFFDVLANNIEIVKALFRQLLSTAPKGPSPATSATVQASAPLVAEPMEEPS